MGLGRSTIYRDQAMASLSDRFNKMAHWTAAQAGHATTFCVALAAIVIWAFSGPIFGFSDTWQLIINTSTTIITFLMVFLIQNTQNRDTAALQLKLDELIRSTAGARPQLMNLEDLDEKQLEALKKEFERLGERRSRSPEARN